MSDGDLRQVCAGEDVFQAYFRLLLPPGAVSRADIDALRAAATEPTAFADMLRTAKDQKLSTGLSKARALLERLMDFVPEEMQAEHAQPVINALFQVGDGRIAYHLLKKVEEPKQQLESARRGSLIH
jgi:predicted KAP-like P-loop ATPase